MNTCVILAGGFGTRLRSAVPSLPKPMAPVHGRPFLEYLISQVRQAGIVDIILSVHYQASVFEAHFRNGSDLGVRIRYSLEQLPLGTAGALAHALPLIQSDSFLAMNGDSFCGVNLAALMARHQERQAASTIVAVETTTADRYGVLTLTDNDEVIGFSEKGKVQGSGFISAGIYTLNKSALAAVPAGKSCSIEHEVFPALVDRGFYAIRTKAVLIDIGTPESYARAEDYLTYSAFNARKPL